MSVVKACLAPYLFRGEKKTVIILRETMEITKIRKIMKSIEHTLTAATFAEEGEAETAHSLMRESRRVLLGIKAGQIDPKTLKYAMNAASRINAHLDILYVNGASDKWKGTSDPVLDPFKSELAAADIPYRLISRTGCLKKQIIEYTNSEREILFAVIESPSTLDDDCNKSDKELSDLWRQLKCPLVVVMDGAGT
jgi:hypothetical protein